MKASADRDLPTCGVCGDPAAVTAALACDRCASPHHPDCWTFNRGCSIFGCGGVEQVPLGVLTTSSLTITESSRPLRPALAPVLRGLGRRFWSRLPFVRGTVLAGVVGTGVAVAVSKLVGADPVRKVEVVLGMFLGGFAYGLIAPFLAPLQLRRPKVLAFWSLLVSVGSFVARDLLELRNMAAVVPFLVTFLGALLFASSTTEVLAGHRTRVGQALGSWAPAARGILGWFATAFGIFLLAFAEDGYLRLTQEIVMTCLALGLMGGAAAVPAMEQGKKAFLAAIAPKELLE